MSANAKMCVSRFGASINVSRTPEFNLILTYRCKGVKRNQIKVEKCTIRVERDSDERHNAHQSHDSLITLLANSIVGDSRRADS